MYNRAVMRRTLALSAALHLCTSTSISSLWSKRTLKSATLWQYNYDTNAKAATVCIPNAYETASLQKAGRRQCSVTCLWNRMLFLSKDYDRQNNEAAEKRTMAITHFHLGFEGQWFWREWRGKALCAHWLHLPTGHLYSSLWLSQCHRPVRMEKEDKVSMFSVN